MLGFPRGKSLFNEIFDKRYIYTLFIIHKSSEIKVGVDMVIVHLDFVEPEDGVYQAHLLDSGLETNKSGGVIQSDSWAEWAATPVHCTWDDWNSGELSELVCLSNTDERVDKSSFVAQSAEGAYERTTADRAPHNSHVECLLYYLFALLWKVGMYYGDGVIASDAITKSCEMVIQNADLHIMGHTGPNNILLNLWENTWEQ